MPTPKRAFFTPMDSWQGEHLSYTQSIEGQYSFEVLEPPRNARVEAYNSATREFQNMIALAIQDRKSLRARGSSWSLSKVGIPDHRLINTKALRIGFTMPARRISQAYAGDRKKLRFLECGFSISVTNRHLFNDGLSLKTSGSNNSQTLAGVVSTGTHGSAFKFGSCQDFVVGLHLVTGPNRQVYLERASYPVAKQGFADRLGADLIRDDVLFNAALVNFGLFGITHGIMIEARDLFVLHAYRSFMKFNAGLKKAISKLDFSGLNLPRSASNLYHFEVFFNPNEGTPPDEAIVILMFEGPFPQSYTPPEWDHTKAGMGASGLEIMGELVGAIPSPLHNVGKPFLNQQVKDKFARYEKTGTIRDIFRGEKTKGKNLACGTAVPLDQAQNVPNIAFDTYEQINAILPLLISVRYVKGTNALLGFTRFPDTCVLELDAVNTSKTRGYVKKVWANLEQAGIPFTLHWGK